jgi:hypothetical protein
MSKGQDEHKERERREDEMESRRAAEPREPHR